MFRPSILLELGLKYRLYDERKKQDSNSKWEYIEQIDFSRAVNDLMRKGVISRKEKGQFDDFNIGTRNTYIHYNIKKLVEDMMLGELKSVNIETGEVTMMKNVKPTDYPSLWFSAKRVRDKKTVISIVSFCITWVNKLLAKAK